MKHHQSEPSIASLVRQILLESPQPLTVAEILQRVRQIRPLDTRSLENTIRSALSSCPLIANDGEGRYGWFPRMLKGSTVRAPLISSDLEAEHIFIEKDLRDLLWPGFFASQGELSDRSPVDAILPDGTRASLPLEHYGDGTWMTTGAPQFWKWLETCSPETGDDLIFEAIDAEQRLYAVRFDPWEGRNPPSLYARTEEVEHAADDHFWLRRAHGLDTTSLVRYLLAAGYYRDPLPPESINLIWNRVYPAHLIGEAMFKLKPKTRRKLRNLCQNNRRKCLPAGSGGSLSPLHRWSRRLPSRRCRRRLGIQGIPRSDPQPGSH